MQRGSNVPLGHSAPGISRALLSEEAAEGIASVVQAQRFLQRLLERRASPGDGDNASPFQPVGVRTSLLSKAWAVAVLASPFQQESLSKNRFPSGYLIKKSF